MYTAATDAELNAVVSKLQADKDLAKHFVEMLLEQAERIHDNEQRLRMLEENQEEQERHLARKLTVEEDIALLKRDVKKNSSLSKKVSLSLPADIPSRSVTLTHSVCLRTRKKSETSSLASML